MTNDQKLEAYKRAAIACAFQLKETCWTVPFDDDDIRALELFKAAHGALPTTKEVMEVMP